MLADPEELPQATYSSLWMRGELVDLVRLLWHQLSRRVRQDVVSFLVGLPRVADQTVAEALAHLARRVPATEWGDADLSRLKERVALASVDDQSDHEALINGWRSVLLGGDDHQTRDHLMLAAGQGSYDALLAIGRLTELSSDAVRGLVATRS